MSDQEDTPELRQALSEAADFLLPLAQAHVASGKWTEIAGWLLMVRDTLAQDRVASQLQ